MMSRSLGVALTAALLTLAAGNAWAGTDAVYQRTQSDGAVSLTNVPDGEGYQVLVTGTRATGPSGSAGSATGQESGASAQLKEVTLAQPELPSESVVPRLVEPPPSIEARKGNLLDPEVAPEVAAALASHAQEQIESAGGHQARLINLYQASMSAFAAKRAGAQDKH